MSLNVTPGDSAADSYASLAEFNTYVGNRLPALSWFATATDPQKEAALRAACREIDSDFDWTGGAVDNVQALCWPRSGMLNRNGFVIPTSGSTSIPVQLKNAQCEFALQLGAGDRLGDNEALKKGVIGLKAGSVELKFSDVQGSKASNYESADVDIRKMQSDLNYVSLAVPDEVRRLLVASWFTQNSVRLPIVFEAI